LTLDFGYRIFAVILKKHEIMKVQTKNLINKKLTMLIVACIVLFHSYTYSQDTYLTYDNNIASEKISEKTRTNIPQRNIIQDNLNYFELEYSFSGLSIANKKVDKTTYNKISIDGYGHMSELGKPEMPSHNDVIAIPENAKIKITIISAESKEYRGYMIHPALEPAIDTEGAPDPAFVIDNSQYNTDEYYPKDIVKIVDVQKLRGTPLAFVQIRPVQFNPVTKKIKVYTNIKYRIEFIGGNKSFERISRESTSHYNKIIKNTVLNSSVIPSAVKSKTSNGDRKDYIIITTSTYSAAADTLAKWKQQLGYTVEIIAKSSWTAAEVKDSIHTRYQNWTPKPDYFVIIGDQADVPAELHLAPNSNSFATDLYFACMDGTSDYIADMAHGRISVTSASEALTVVQKMVNYERNPISDATYYSTGVNFGEFQDDNTDGYADRRFCHTNEDINSYLVSRGYNMSREYYTPTTVTPTNYNSGYYSSSEAIPSTLLKSNSFPWISDGGVGNVHSNFNAGRFLAVHRGHGYDGGWGWCHPFFVSHPYYHNIDDLTNGEKLPVLISIDCHSGDFNTANCLAENFIRKSNGGAVGVIAASFYSYSGPNDGFALGLIDAIWSNPGLVPSFGAGGISNPTLSSHSDIHTMGDVLNQGLIRMMETWTGSTVQNQYTSELFHYFGDPAMKIWTSAPTTITATHNDTLPKNSTTLTINNSSCIDGLATLYFQGELIGQTQLANGTGTISFIAMDTANAILTISKHNYRPYISNIQINNGIAATPPVVQASNISFSQSSKTTTSITVNWVNGDGDRRLVKVNTENTFSNPVDGEEYTANTTYDGNGEQVVYNDNRSSVTVDNLTEGVTYWFRVYEYNNFGEFTKYTTITETNNPNTDGGSIPLPVELLSFTAKYTGNSVELNWKTASEINNDYFVIERSLDAENFEPISTIIGAGNSNTTLNYSSTDFSPLNGIAYYRLTQKDYNGNIDNLQTASVNCTQDSKFEIVNIINNDNNVLTVFINTSSTQKLTFNLIGVNGQQILSKSENPNINGVNKISFNLPELNQGIYVLNVQNSKESISKNFFLK